MTRVLVPIVILILLGFGMAEWMRRQSLFYPERHPAGEWDTRSFPLQPEDVTFSSADGTELHGWLFRSASDGDSPLVVFFHGNGGNLTYRAGPAIALAEAGLDVFVFDYRGYGRSRGHPTESSLYDDSLAAWDFMRERHRGPMLAYGESLGGPYAAFVASRREACAVIADSTFPSIRAVAREVYRPIPVHWLLRPGLQTSRFLQRASVPVLVMHSLDDEVIPFRLGQELHDTIEGPRRMYQARSAQHAAIFWSSPDEYVRTIRDFAEEHCGGASLE